MQGFAETMKPVPRLIGMECPYLMLAGGDRVPLLLTTFPARAGQAGLGAVVGVPRRIVLAGGRPSTNQAQGG